MLSIPVSASSGLSVGVVGPQTVNAGQEIELIYSFSSIDGKGLCGLDLEISFNRSLVRFSSVSLVGFPSGSSWTAAGRVAGSTYMLHVFDDYANDEPTSIYQGTNAYISVKFRTLDSAMGNACFSTKSAGAVMGCYFENGETKSFTGEGNEHTVYIKGNVKDHAAESYRIKNGTVLALAGVTANDLVYTASSVTDAKGNAKSADAPLVTGDVIDFGEGYKESTVMLLCDLNMDGMVSTNDYMLLKMHISNKRKLPDAAILAADINIDGIVSAADAIGFAMVLRGETIALSGAAA